MENTGTRLAVIADKIRETLDLEARALGGLRDCIRSMLTTLREGDGAGLDSKAADLQDRLHDAVALRQGHGRQLGLFARIRGAETGSISEVLATLSEHPQAVETRRELRKSLSRVRDVTAETGQVMAAFEFALRYAAGINHELVCMLHGALQPDGGRVYTARGATTAPKNRRSLVDRMG